MTNNQKQAPASILIVDDTPDNLRLLTNILTGQGYQVRPAPNGLHALATVQKAQPDLILLDIMMPDLGGYEVCQRLKADERSRDIPVIFISALDDLFDKMTAFSVGGIDYITKPFEEAEVLARVKTHLTIGHLQQVLQQKNEALQAANQSLEEKVQARTVALAQANDDLQAEIEQRIQHQREKDRLFSLVSQQSEQIRAMTTLLIQSQQADRQGLALNLREEIAQRVALLQANLNTTKQMLSVTNLEIVAQHLDSALHLLAQMEDYMAQITDDLSQPTSQEQDVSQNPLIKLSEREREVLQLLAQGKSGHEIAQMINIATASVHTYTHRIKTKLDLFDLPGLIKFALEHKLVE